MASGAIIPAESSPGDDYPNLDTLFRQLPSPVRGHQIFRVQVNILPSLGSYLLGKCDDNDKRISGVLVREIAYDFALNVVAKAHEDDDLRAIPDVVALAVGTKDPPGRPDSERPSAAESHESDPCTQAS
jgi:hypothetical protein